MKPLKLMSYTARTVAGQDSAAADRGPATIVTNDNDSPTRKKQTPLTTNAAHNVMTLASLPHNAELRFPIPRLAGFASIVCLGHLNAEGVNNSMTAVPDWHSA